ncbi:MAG: hypothetical protein J6Y99_08050 [Bacteroidales bacterium]|nr:hypothetical protein [Bacteroidales bacterium]
MHRKRLKVWMGIICLLICASCSSREEQIKLLKQTQIHIPLEQMEKLPSPIQKDTSMNDADLYFLAYEDSTSCNTCKLSHIGNWNSVMNKVNTRAKVALLFTISPKEAELEEVKQLYYSKRVPFPIYIDAKGALETTNPLLCNTLFHYLLIDNKGKVLYLGDPTKSATSEEMLLRTIDYWSEHYKNKR